MKKQEKTMTYSEYCQNRTAKSMFWFGGISIILGLFSLIFSCVYVNSHLVQYYHITENIEIKDISASQLYTMCVFEDDACCMSFEGKYDGEKAIVALSPEIEECQLTYDDGAVTTTVYVVDLYAIATTIKDGYYFVNSEYVFTYVYGA